MRSVSSSQGQPFNRGAMGFPNHSVTDFLKRTEEKGIKCGVQTSWQWGLNGVPAQATWFAMKSFYILLY